MLLYGLPADSFLSVYVQTCAHENMRHPLWAYGRRSIRELAECVLIVCGTYPADKLFACAADRVPIVRIENGSRAFRMRRTVCES